ncbi:MAG: 23S rRNA (pseudouridine(1915)-N(3))-methyltransferase RlmH [Alloprevotella sp.]
MKIHLLVVGRTVNQQLAALIDDYAGRLIHYAPFAIEVVPGPKHTKSLSESQQCEREGEQLLGALRPDDYVVLLDEGGRQYRSVEFAAWLSTMQQQSVRRLVFVVGGPYGFSPAVRRAARDRLSLSSMTFSHQLIRLLFTEQLYRAMTILRGEPYHHE